ncbi:hypothetical protein [Bradyrhizobium guangdongense]|uniref:Uncharacterized protein n=1 Tax=Bradyrhizobium guangdongense TaxID=1325090 RepID=A0A410V6N0_9BRAD|nr:hypothetical protein [Bradyrhizobium guangdongense]QAU39318.1 hypothetical protein X265_17875 [Bradyrhizobium guangdongense]QOZ63826.1 hypothetical protein XH86_17880 [Bradyrhizobium guangdongense]GGI32024.1 hypothetical protein GCM10010987_67370 [Bradyrhizobium guangdongense]
MSFDLRAVVIAASLVLASIAVAAAEGAQDQPARIAAGTTDHAGDSRPVRVILPAPWEPAPASSGTQAMVQK